MFFRNLTLFTFPPSLLARLVYTETERLIAAHPLKPVGPLELSSHGFVSPLGSLSPDVFALFSGADDVLVTLGSEHKLLPAAVVNKALAEKLDALAAREGRRPGGRERKRIRDEVLTDLLPRAFCRPRRLNAWLDTTRGWLVVDTASRPAAEQLVNALREAFGSFPALPVNAESSVRALMTGWLAGEALPEGFALGDECELHDPSDTRATWRGRRTDLSSEQVREHLNAGMQAWRVALVFEERMSFVLGDDLVIRKLRFLDTVTQQLDDLGPDDATIKMDATFALMAGELRGLLERLAIELTLTREGG